MFSAAVALPRAFVQPGPAGQLQVAVPGVSRGRYATGQQEPCAPCAAAGVHRQGVSRDGAGSTALCMSCWRAGEQRRLRVEQAEQDRQVWDSVGELDTGAAAEESCGACGEVEASQACWLCGWSWLRQLRAQFEADQAAAAEAAELQSAWSAECAEAQARVADLTKWITRLRKTLAMYQSGGGGRAVELVADLLARLAVQAAGRTSRRGRPSVTPYVGAVLANDADWDSGRRTLPGRARTAWLLDCSDRAVYDAWRQVSALGWAKRTRIGGRNSKQRREETGRANDRAEFDLVPLHRSSIDVATRAQYLAQALELLGELLQRALVVLEREQEALDAARARAGTWTDYPEMARRVQLRAAVARTHHTITGPVPAALTAANTCRSHPVSQGEYLRSCSYWGLRFTSKIMIHSAGCGLRPDGRGQGGASRSSTERDSADLGGRCGGAPCVSRPRTTKTGRRRSPTRTTPPWADWAPELARDLVTLWPWLTGSPRTWIVALLGSELSADWNAAELARWVADQLGRPILATPARPAAYLRSVLTEVFSATVAPPHPTRRHTEHRRQTAAAERAALAQRQSAMRAELDARDAAAAAATGTGRAAARAALARITASRQAPVALTDCPWPEVTAPGSGSRPPDRR